jgi:hypothetical protein
MDFSFWTFWLPLSTSGNSGQSDGAPVRTGCSLLKIHQIEVFGLQKHFETQSEQSTYRRKDLVMNLQCQDLDALNKLEGFIFPAD